ncbi:hypothetical protein F750_4568 [Streptomyces sp. PAMC 26508]|nr:hypothetical protein F750_4568 [Streptomyces sp. PAMC 26508]
MFGPRTGPEPGPSSPFGKFRDLRRTPRPRPRGYVLPW